MWQRFLNSSEEWHLWACHLPVDGGVDVLQGQRGHRGAAVVRSCRAGFRRRLPKARLKARAPLLLLRSIEHRHAQHVAKMALSARPILTVQRMPY